MKCVYCLGDEVRTRSDGKRNDPVQLISTGKAKATTDFLCSRCTACLSNKTSKIPWEPPMRRSKINGICRTR